MVVLDEVVDEVVDEVADEVVGVIVIVTVQNLFICSTMVGIIIHQSFQMMILQLIVVKQFRFHQVTHLKCH